MVEKYSAAREQSMCFAVVDGHPVRVKLGDCVWAARMKRGAFVLRRRRQTKHLGGRRLVEARGEAGGANGLEQACRAQSVSVARVLRLVERDVDVALRRKVVDLARPPELDQPVQDSGGGHVRAVQDAERAIGMGGA